MAKDFVKLSEVAVREEVSENATVLVEENGEIYRAPKTSVGGGAGGIKTAIIREKNFMNFISNKNEKGSVGGVGEYECLNMTYEEARETLENGEPLMVMGMLAELDFYPTCLYGEIQIGSEFLKCVFYYSDNDYKITLVWESNYLGRER